MSTELSLPGNEPITMSSREIAKLLGNRHDKVKQSIERLVERGVIVQPPMGDEQDTDAMGRKRTTSVYQLEKRDSYVVVAQLSPEFTAKLVDRWQELEARTPALPNFSDPAAAARAWAEQHERAVLAEQRSQQSEKLVQLAERKAEAMAADHDALHRIAMADGSMTITSAAKVLQMRPKDLFAWLRQNRWIYRRTGGGSDLGYQDKVQSGFLEHKTTTVTRSDGTSKVTEQVRVTPKGLVTLGKRLNKSPDAPHSDAAVFSSRRVN